MFSHRLFWLGILTGLVGALVGLILAIPSSGLQASASFPQDFSYPQLSPDPRWLDLLRSFSSAGVRLQSTAPSLHIHLTDRMVAGRMPAPAPVSVQVHRNGIIVAAATAHPFPDGDGYLYIVSPASFYPDGCGGACGCFSFQPGDEVRATQGSTVVSLTVPLLTALADPAADIVSGTAPSSATLALYLYPRSEPSAVLTATAAADDQGAYQANWHPTDLRPGDSGYAVWRADPHRAAYVRFVAPLLQVQWNSTIALGMAAPCSTVRLTATDSEGQWLEDEWAWADQYGFFQARLYWKEGIRPLQPGDRVIGEARGQTFATTVLSVTVRTDRQGGRVLGTAPPGAGLRALRFPGPLRYSRSVREQMPTEEVTGTVETSGHYTLPLALAPADYGAVFITGPDGHETFARFAVPYLFARLGRRGPALVVPDNVRLWGQVDGVNIPITVAVGGPRGYLKDLRFLTSGDGGDFSDLASDDDVLLETGDTLTVTTPEGVRAAVTLPTLTVRADPLSDTVSGEAPPGARLEVFVYAAPLGLYGGGGGPEYPLYQIISRAVTATAEGTYVADFRGLADIAPGSAGEVVLYLSEDAAVSRPFIPSTCRPTLTGVVVGGNYVAGLSGPGCPSATVTLLDPAGGIKAQGVADFQWRPEFYFYFYLYPVCPPPSEKCDTHPIPVLILPSDRIEIRSSGEVLTWTVPTLTLEITPNGLVGRAPPNERLTAEFWSEDQSYHRIPITATAQGTYTLLLTGSSRPLRSTVVRVLWRSGETFFVAQDCIPSLQAVFFHDRIYGRIRPLSPYTVTPILATGYAGPYGDFSAPIPPLFPGERVTVTTPREVLSLTMPFLSARIDRAAATVLGEGPPNALLEITLNFPYGFSTSRRVTTTETGAYTVSFPELSRFAQVQGVVGYLTPEGHDVFFHFGMRQWNVWLGEPCVSGYADAGGAPFTLTLRSGLEEETVTGAAWYDGSFSACFSRPIRPGDLLTLTQTTGLMTFTVPTLTAVHDFGRQVLEGEALTGSLIEAAFGYGYFAPVRRTRADASGRYGLDTSGMNLRVGQTGYVRMTDGEGNTVQADFTVQGYRVYLPVVLR